MYHAPNDVWIPEFDKHADKHRISKARSAYIVDTVRRYLEVDRPDGVGLMFLGDDWNGIALEVLGIPGQKRKEGQVLRIIHANYVSDEWADDYERLYGRRPR